MRLFSAWVAILAVVPAQAEDETPEIAVTGAPEALADNIRAHLSMADEACRINERRLKPLRRRSDEEIRNAGRALGYYHLTFEKHFERTESCWRLRIDITPGEPVIVRQVNVRFEGEAEGDTAFADYVDDTPPAIGDRLNHGVYDKFKSGLRNLAVERGYFDAEFKQSRLLIHPADYRADIDIVYDSGPRYRFGETAMESDILADDLLNRYLNFKAGDPFSSDRLTALQQALESAGYFERVSVQPQIEQRGDNRVPIHIELRPRKQHAYSVGIGAATDTGPRLRFGYENRYINRRGHQLNYDLTLSPVRSETQLNYTIPMEKPGSEHLNFYTGYATEDTDTTLEETATIGTSYTQLLKRDWLQSYFINFQRENYEVADIERRTDLLLPGVSWSKTKSDDPFYPLDGWRAFVKVSAASEDLLSDTSLVQGHLRAKLIRGLGPGRLLLRGEVGSTEVDDFDVLPTSLRFFAGGDNSVRGYKYRSLGPTDAEGNVIGGANLLVGSVEYDIRFAGNWAVAVFYDQGNAFDETNTDPKRGAGIGLRWISPIGPIRLDLASALDNDNKLRLHLSMGPDL